jgi:hypothetical protein
MLIIGDIAVHQIITDSKEVYIKRERIGVDISGTP